MHEEKFSTNKPKNFIQEILESKSANHHDLFSHKIQNLSKNKSPLTMSSHSQGGCSHGRGGGHTSGGCSHSRSKKNTDFGISF